MRSILPYSDRLITSRLFIKPSFILIYTDLFSDRKELKLFLLDLPVAFLIMIMLVNLKRLRKGGF